MRGRNYSTESASEEDSTVLCDSALLSSTYSCVNYEQPPPMHPAPLPPHEDEIQYLDLDLKQEKEDNIFVDIKGSKNSQFGSVNSLTPSVRESHTVYKTVDFVATKAFNKLRKQRDLQHCCTSEPLVS